MLAAPVDLPPPPPQSDPREPSPTTVIRGRGGSTPRKPHSPQPSRGTSPIRPAVPRAQSSEHSALTTPSKSGSPPLIAPTPLSFRQVQGGGISSSGGGVHHPHPHPHPHSHSRSASPAGSMHSSTSAIFERDIEHPPVASLSLNPNPPQTHTLNHKSSRLSHLSHGSNLDHTVPAVLDDAVEALAGSSRGFQGLEIESPAPVGGGSAMTRQASAQASARKPSTTGLSATSPPRSPSPISIVSGVSARSPTRSPPILGAISTGNPVGGTISPLDKSPASSFDAGNVPRPPMPGRLSTGPQLPGAWAFGKDEDRSRKDEDKASTVPTTDPIAEAEVAPAGPATAVTTAEEVSSMACILSSCFGADTARRLRPLRCPSPGAPSPLRRPCHPTCFLRTSDASLSSRTTTF